MMSFNARFWKVLLLAGAAAAVTSCVEGDREGGTAANQVDWADVTNKPAGFDDNIDDGSSYTAGAGIYVDSFNNIISVDLLVDDIAVNTGTGLVHWTQLEGVPPSIAAGGDYTSGNPGIVVDNALQTIATNLLGGPGILVDNAAGTISIDLIEGTGILVDNTTGTVSTDLIGIAGFGLYVVSNQLEVYTNALYPDFDTRYWRLEGSARSGVAASV